MYVPQHIEDNPTHNFDWANTLILDRECNREKRLISEILHINWIDNTINRQEDTQFLNNQYKRLKRILNKFDIKEKKNHLATL